MPLLMSRPKKAGKKGRAVGYGDFDKIEVRTSGASFPSTVRGPREIRGVDRVGDSSKCQADIHLGRARVYVIAFKIPRTSGGTGNLGIDISHGRSRSTDKRCTTVTNENHQCLSAVKRYCPQTHVSMAAFPPGVCLFPLIVMACRGINQ
jgi:hypothetical protein